MEIAVVIVIVIIGGLALLMFSNFGKDPTKKTTSQLERELALHDQVIATTDVTSSAYQRRSEARDRVEKELQRRGTSQVHPAPSEPATLPAGDIRKVVAAGYEEGWRRSKSEGKDDKKALETALVSGLLNRLVGIDGWSAIAPEMVQAMLMETMPFKFAGSRDECRQAVIEYAVWREHPDEADAAIVERAVSSMAEQMKSSGSTDLLQSLRNSHNGMGNPYPRLTTLEETQMECPVCEGPAEDITNPGFDGRAARCPECGDFEVAGTVARRLSELTPEDRRSVLQRAVAFATPGQRPAINSLTL